MLKTFVFVFSFFCVFAFGQKKTDTLRLYFNINEITSVQNNLKLDSALKAIDKRSMDVAVYGYADFLSNNKYNIFLSQKRADNVKQYLLDNAAYNQINIYACEGRGEKYSKDNGNSKGDMTQRRVDIYFEPVVTLNVSDDKLETPKQKDSFPPVSTDSKIENLVIGQSLALEGLSFEPGRHFILKESVPVLQKLLTALNENTKLRIEIQGHVCCTLNGADGMDLDTREMKLSENRAKAIYDYLVGKGINRNRLSYKGFGRTKPKVEIETNSEQEQLNRRVEIMIIEK
jgi:outer membrane protein OmpA-like peptidoglycan-associated protein